MKMVSKEMLEVLKVWNKIIKEQRLWWPVYAFLGVLGIVFLFYFVVYAHKLERGYIPPEEKAMNVLEDL
jgi:hypothetical protein